MSAKVYVYPRVSGSSSYTARLISELSAPNAQVEYFRLWPVVKSILNHNQTVLVLNWVEGQILKPGIRGELLRWILFSKASEPLKKVFGIKIKIVWHNIFSVKYSDKNRLLKIRSLMSRRSNVYVMNSVVADQFSVSYFTHPPFFDKTENLNRPIINKTPSIVYFGGKHKFPPLPELLAVSKHLRMRVKIVGQCCSNLGELTELVSEQIDISPGRLSDEDLYEAVSTSSACLVSVEKNDPIISGTAIYSLECGIDIITTCQYTCDYFKKIGFEVIELIRGYSIVVYNKKVFESYFYRSSAAKLLTGESNW
ncbi:hypothetical protein [Limnobacter sp. MED105]|uniref:hypothetical protein n=1 Tax=Limnobacter sp. MED105 TaxID=391597 RepID=UPI00031E5C1A|nr:hypothetical protein [Limnobacter sp. MED105]